MKKTLAASSLFLALAAMWAVPAFARDTTYHVPLEEVLNMPEAHGKLDGSVKFYLSGQATPAVEQIIGEDVTNRKTNGVGKDDMVGCKWAALSALIALQDRAKQFGANAVVELHSFYKKEAVKSATNVECHAGAVIIGVALKGSYAKVAP